MASEESVADTPRLTCIQINGERTARVTLMPSMTVDKVRAHLIKQEVQLPQNVQFFDAQGYPVSTTNEKSCNIRELLVSTSDGETIKLRTRESSPNVLAQPSTMMTIVKRLIIVVATLYSAFYMSQEENRNSLLCPVFVKMNSSSLLDKFRCPMDQDTYTDTTDYMKQKISKDHNGAEVLISTKKGLKRVDLKDSGEYFVSIYDDWMKNESVYKADYDWYNGMLSSWGHCPGRFDEKVMNSDNIIRDTPDSIEEFTHDEFEDWPQKTRSKLNMKNRLKAAINDDGDEFSLDSNGKIASNMYLAAWRREEDDTIHIQTYVTIFERTAGKNCHFEPKYWNGHRDKITNAKKYFLLTKVKTNPAFRNFFNEYSSTIINLSPSIHFLYLTLSNTFFSRRLFLY